MFTLEKWQHVSTLKQTLCILNKINLCCRWPLISHNAMPEGIRDVSKAVKNEMFNSFIFDWCCKLWVSYFGLSEEHMSDVVVIDQCSDNFLYEFMIHTDPRIPLHACALWNGFHTVLRRRPSSGNPTSSVLSPARRSTGQLVLLDRGGPFISWHREEGGDCWLQSGLLKQQHF